MTYYCTISNHIKEVNSTQRLSPSPNERRVGQCAFADTEGRTVGARLVRIAQIERSAQSNAKQSFKAAVESAGAMGIGRVLAREFLLISMGTRGEAGTRAFALLASVIETCRKRSFSRVFVTSVVAAARTGLAMPSLPAIPVGERTVTGGLLQFGIR